MNKCRHRLFSTKRQRFRLFVHFYLELDSTTTWNLIMHTSCDCLAAIERAIFHYFVRTIPGNGLIIANGREESIQRVLAQGCSTPRWNW